jgi:hypothetical protein
VHQSIEYDRGSSVNWTIQLRYRGQVLAGIEEAARYEVAESGADRRRVYRKRAARLAMVHVSSQCLHRQNVVTVMTLAKVSMTLPLQNGHAAGRVTGSLRCGSNMAHMLHVSPSQVCSFVHTGLIRARRWLVRGRGSSQLMFKSEQPRTHRLAYD